MSSEKKLTFFSIPFALGMLVGFFTSDQPIEIRLLATWAVLVTGGLLWNALYRKYA